MKRTRLLLGLAAFWEVVRFSLFFFLLETGLSGEGAGALPFALWFGGPQLVIGVGFAAVAVFPDRYDGLVSLGILGKAVSLAMGFVSILTGSLPLPGFETGLLPVLRTLGPVAILAVDILMVLLLLGAQFSLTRGKEA